MKKLLVVTALALAMIAGAGAPAEARESGYRCVFAESGVYSVFYGSDVTPGACRAAHHGFGRRVSRAFGRTYCVFGYDAMDIKVAIRSTSAARGRIFCAGLDALLPARGWYRVR
jgi:hypothetical protein